MQLYLLSTDCFPKSKSFAFLLLRWKFFISLYNFLYRSLQLSLYLLNLGPCLLPSIWSFDSTVWITNDVLVLNHVTIHFTMTTTSISVTLTWSRLSSMFCLIPILKKAWLLNSINTQEPFGCIKDKPLPQWPLIKI